MDELILTFPWPPSVNHYKKVGGLVRTKSGKIYQKRINTKETTDFYYRVYSIATLGMPVEWPKYRDREDISYKVYLTLYPPDKRRRDIDNTLKVLLDSLMHGKIIHDDSQIVFLCVEKKEFIDKGQVLVKINPILPGEIHHDAFC